MKRLVFCINILLMLILVSCQLSTTPPPLTATRPATLPATVVPASITAVSFNPDFEFIGEVEEIFDWDTDRCDDQQYADLPARAIRTSDGRVHIYVSSTTNYRLIGDDLNSLAVDCSPVLLSDFDRNPANYSHSEWMAAPYTLDGQTIYAIIHQEYHGDQAGSIWQAEGEFGPIQGETSWTYHGWDGLSLSEMTFADSDNAWVGAKSLCLIGSNWVHPDAGCDPNRTWTSPITGMVTINGNTYDGDPSGGDGVIAQIFRGEEQIWSATIENGDELGASFNLELSVEEGEKIHFRVMARDNANNDWTYFNPGINIGPPPCPSDRHDLCTLISLTHATSTDGGATFHQPPAPNHLIANFPYQYDPDWMRAIWQPSNIVLNPKDGYFYALIQLDNHAQDLSTNVQGMCVMRTQTLEEPSSWRAWDGSGFNMEFINPYVETNVNPEEYTCDLVSPEVGALTYGLSYNIYFEKFVAVGVGFEGFYYSLSDDLINWSPRQFLMEAPQL